MKWRAFGICLSKETERSEEDGERAPISQWIWCGFSLSFHGNGDSSSTMGENSRNFWKRKASDLEGCFWLRKIIQKTTNWSVFNHGFTISVKILISTAILYSLPLSPSLSFFFFFFSHKGKKFKYTFCKIKLNLNKNLTRLPIKIYVYNILLTFTFQHVIV